MTECDPLNSQIRTEGSSSPTPHPHFASEPFSPGGGFLQAQGEPDLGWGFGQLEVPGRTAQLLKDEGGAPGRPEHWQQSPKGYLLHAPTFTPVTSWGLALAGGWGGEGINRRPPEDFSWGGAGEWRYK